MNTHMFYTYLYGAFCIFVTVIGIKSAIKSEDSLSRYKLILLIPIAWIAGVAPSMLLLPPMSTKPQAIAE